MKICSNKRITKKKFTELCEKLNYSEIATARALHTGVIRVKQLKKKFKIVRAWQGKGIFCIDIENLNKMNYINERDIGTAVKVNRNSKINWVALYNTRIKRKARPVMDIMTINIKSYKAID